MSPKFVNLSLNIDGYRNQLEAEVKSHLARLRLVVDSAGELDVTGGKGFFSWTITQPDKEELVQSQIDDCYKAIMSSLQDYVDRLIASKRLTEQPLKVEAALNSKEEIAAYIQEIEQSVLKTVATDTSLNVPKKLELVLGEDKDTIDYIQRYFSLRNALEHHKGIPKEDITLVYRKVALRLEDGEEITGPTKVEAGQLLSVAFEPIERRFPAGDKVHLSIEELDNIAHTVLSGIASSLMDASITKIKA